MLKEIEILLKPRLHLFELIAELTIEQLNKVPAGFNNNIVWNLAHMVAAQQGVCYMRAGLPKIIDEQFYQAHKPDTKPEKFVDATELAHIKKLAVTTLEQLEIDLGNNLFVNYQPWIARYGVEISNITEALKFLPFHEGLHYGYVMALRRAVLQEQ